MYFSLYIEQQVSLVLWFGEVQKRLSLIGYSLSLEEPMTPQYQTACAASNFIAQKTPILSPWTLLTHSKEVK